MLYRVANWRAIRDLCQNQPHNATCGISQLNLQFLCVCRWTICRRCSFRNSQYCNLRRWHRSRNAALANRTRAVRVWADRFYWYSSIEGFINELQRMDILIVSYSQSSDVSKLNSFAFNASVETQQSREHTATLDRRNRQSTRKQRRHSSRTLSSEPPCLFSNRL